MNQPKDEFDPPFNFRNVRGFDATAGGGFNRLVPYQ